MITHWDGLPPACRDAWEERTAILEFEAGLSRPEADLKAFQLTLERMEEHMPEINMDVRNEKPFEDYDVPPDGTYRFRIADSKLAETQNRDTRLVFTYEVDGGEFSGARIFDGFMLTGSEKAVQIGRRRMRSLCDAIGHPGAVRNSEEIHGRAFDAEIKTTKDKEGRENTRIKFIAPSNGSHGAPPAPGGYPAPPAGGGYQPLPSDGHPNQPPRYPSQPNGYPPQQGQPVQSGPQPGTPWGPAPR